MQKDKYKRARQNTQFKEKNRPTHTSMYQLSHLLLGSLHVAPKSWLDHKRLHVHLRKYIVAEDQ